MIKIDWRMAPDWADGHGLIAFQGFTEVWINADQYAPVGREGGPYPWGCGTGDTRHNHTRGQVQYITPRPTRWDGDGLPPVGTVCEFKANILGWVEATITAVTALSIVFTRPSYQNGRPLVEDRLPHKAIERFRPIRTPEQIAAEERRTAIECLAGELGGHWSEDAKAPHRVMAAYLYDAGYRKQVAP